MLDEPEYTSIQDLYRKPGDGKPGDGNLGTDGT